MNARKVMKKGFTLIEVVIVLAIAALIMVVVFLAVTGAQRAQRDQARKDYANAGLAKLNEFNGNNGAGVTVLDANTFSDYMGNRTINGTAPTPVIGTAAVTNTGCTFTAGTDQLVVENGAATPDQHVAICLEAGVWYTASAQ